MKVYVVCNGELGHGQAPLLAFKKLNKAITFAEMYAIVDSSGPYVKVDDYLWRSGCDLLSIKTMEVL